MLAVNQESMRRQTDSDWVQTLLVDEQGVGINASHERLGAYAPNLVGDFVWILDDDDECICPTLVSDLKRIVSSTDANLIMLRMDHGGGRVLPSEATWGDDLIYGQIGVSAYVVERNLWQQHAGALTPGWYGSDYSLIRAIMGGVQDVTAAMHWAVWMRKPRVRWHDCIASRVQAQSFGKAEGG